LKKNLSDNPTVARVIRLHRGRKIIIQTTKIEELARTGCLRPIFNRRPREPPRIKAPPVPVQVLPSPEQKPKTPSSTEPQPQVGLTPPPLPERSRPSGQNGEFRRIPLDLSSFTDPEESQPHPGALVQPTGQVLHLPVPLIQEIFLPGGRIPNKRRYQPDWEEADV